ncbi:MAG: hypothetical protein FJ387_13225 [Verrucomicrobia bacterium]|nr:hypothetical protein [Verrucomicrobiota bacterium]
MNPHRLPLPGCAPIPLGHYLKALGILRLVAEDCEHGDPPATGERFAPYSYSQIVILNGFLRI